MSTKSRSYRMFTRSPGRRRSVFALAALGGMVAASVVAAAPASAVNCFGTGQTPKITNVKYTATSTYTLRQYNVASSGATTEQTISTVPRSLGSITMRYGSCAASGVLSTTASLPRDGANTTDVDTILSGSLTSVSPTVSYKPTNGSKGWVFYPGVSAEGSGYYTASMGGLVCTAGTSTLPGIVGLIGEFIPIPGGKVKAAAIQTAGSWLLDYWKIKSTYSGCTQPPNSSTTPELVEWKMTRASSGALTLPSSRTRTLSYSKYVSNATYCTATSNIDCGLHYQTYITITASIVP